MHQKLLESISERVSITSGELDMLKPLFIQLADQLGLDVFGVGEHHWEDYAVSSQRRGFDN